MTASAAARPQLLLGAAAVLALAGAVLLLGGDPQQAAPPPAVSHTARQPARWRPVAPAATRLATPPTPAARVTPPVTPAAQPTPPDLLAGPASDTVLQQLLDGSAPANLPAELARHLSGLAARLVIADLTGRGRGAFPGYWTGPPRRVYTHVRVQATSARAAVSGPPALVDVVVLWAGRDPDGVEVDRRRAVVRLARDSAGSWQPRPMAGR